MIVAIYPRKSKRDDESQSMETQIAMCREYVLSKFPDAKILLYDKDYGITGHSIVKRKDFIRMMDDVKSGLIKLVVVQRYDRLARNIRDFCNVYHDMEEVGCELVSVSQKIDTTTAYGKNFMYQQASMAELEWALCSERHKDVNRYAMLQGKCNLSPYAIPVGYKAEKIDGVRRMVKDEATAPIIEYMIQCLHNGESRTSLVRMINKKFGTSYSHALWQTFARSSFYYGSYRENLNYCEPYLSKEEWEKLTAKKENRVRYHDDDNKNMLFTGLVKCPVCGTRLAPQVGRNKGYSNYFYYRCRVHYASGNCSFNKNVSERKIENYLLDNIDLKLHNISVKTVAISSKKLKDNKDYKSELSRLNSMFLKGRISEKEYDTEYDRISKMMIETTDQPKEIDVDSLKEVFTKDWKEIYNNLTKQNKKRFWKGVIEEVKINEDKECYDIIFLK